MEPDERWDPADWDLEDDDQDDWITAGCIRCGEVIDRIHGKQCDLCGGIFCEPCYTIHREEGVAS